MLSLPRFTFWIIFGLFFGMGAVQSEEFTPTPTPVSTTAVVFNLDSADLESNHLTAIIPAGYRSPKLTFGAIPENPGSDNKGMTITLPPGTGYLIVSLDQVKAPDDLPCRVRQDVPGARGDC